MTAIQFTSGSSKASIWQQHFIQWQSSGLTQKAYCRQFLYWRARAAKNEKPLKRGFLMCSTTCTALRLFRS
jgi:hypothetical protein